MVTKADSNRNLRDADGGNGFDVVLLPHGSTEPDIVVGRLAPGSRGVLVNTNGVQRAKRWLRAKGGTVEVTMKSEYLERRVIRNVATTGMEHAPAITRKAAIVEAHAAADFGKLVKTMAKLGKEQESFRKDLRAAIADGEEMLKDVVG